MKTHLLIKNAALALACWALIHSTVVAQTVLTNSYTNSFPSGGNSTDFFGSGSVASYLYWYASIPASVNFNNTAMTNDPAMDAGGDTNTSGSLYCSLPFSATSQQVQMFGTFDNKYGYDASTVMALNIVTQLAFDIHVQPGTITNSSGNFGQITLSLVDPKWSNGGRDGTWTPITIPATATNGWVHLVDSNTVADIKTMVTAGFSMAAGFGLYVNSYGGYPTHPVTFWIDNLAAVTATAAPPPPQPPALSPPQLLDNPGLNLLMVNGGNQYTREMIAAGNTGYGINDGTNITYSWTITGFPSTAHTGFQQHFFICTDDRAGAGTGTSATDNSADYNSSNVIFITVQQNTNGLATMSFRWKTNEPSGNGEIFPSSTNTYPYEPFATVTNATALGKWSVNVQGGTNFTLTSPSGNTTNFIFPPAAAALFADPVVIYLGDQANSVADEGQDVVYSQFSITGSAADFTDVFANDTSLQAPWVNDNTDAGALNFIAAGSINLLVSWGFDNNFDLEAGDSLDTPDWVYLTDYTGMTTGTLTTFTDVSSRAALVTLPISGLGTNDLYFRVKNAVATAGAP